MRSAHDSDTIEGKGSAGNEKRCPRLRVKMHKRGVVLLPPLGFRHPRKTPAAFLVAAATFFREGGGRGGGGSWV